MPPHALPLRALVHPFPTCKSQLLRRQIIKIGANWSDPRREATKFVVLIKGKFTTHYNPN